MRSVLAELISRTRRGIDLDMVPEWHEDAACASHETDYWFADGRGSEARAATATAIAICESCPVQPLCLADALKRREEYGIWGGTTPPQRRRMLKDAA